MRNIIKYFILAFIIFQISACDFSNNKDPQNKQLDKVIIDNTLSISEHYSYYINSPFDSIRGIIVVLDPHSKPYLVMDSLHKYADANFLAIIGIKEVHNGIKNYDEIINRDIKHFKKLNSFHSVKTYLLGFSGAARMAEYYSHNHRIDGIIMCGAGMQRQAQLPFPTVLLSGTKDFNFIEQYYDPSSPYTFNKNIFAFNFRGKHKWPPVNIILHGLDFIIHRKKGGNDSISENFEQKSLRYLNSKEYYFAFKFMEAAYKYSNHTDNDKLKSHLQHIINNKNVKNYFRRTNLYLEEEVKRYRMLTEYLDTKDYKWWKNQINFIEYKSNKKDPISADSYARTKAYLGIVVYSKINHALTGRGNTEKLMLYLYVYELIEPDSPFLFYFKSVVEYRTGDEQIAISHFKKAQKMGFDNLNAARKYFSEDFLNKCK